MNSFPTISNAPVDTKTVEDHLPPTRTQLRTSLQEALNTQHDKRIDQLLKQIRHEPNSKMAGIVGEVYFQANKVQQLAFDIWSGHLSYDQLSCFEAEREDARCMEYAHLLTIALQKPHDRLLGKLLHVAGALDNVRIFQLIGMHYDDAQPAQKQKIDAWRLTLSEQQAQDSKPWVEYLSYGQLSCFEAGREDARCMEYAHLLTIALQKPHDRLLGKLLHVAGALDNVRIFQLIGMHYADAQPAQKQKIDAWRLTLSEQQAQDSKPWVEFKERHLIRHALPFLGGKELLRTAATSKGLKQAIQQEPSLSGRMLSQKISSFTSTRDDPENHRLKSLLKEISQLKDEPLQLDLLKQLVAIIAGLEDTLDRREIADLLEFTDSTLSMASRASLLETVAAHFLKLEGKERREMGESQRSIPWFNDNPLRETFPNESHFRYAAPGTGVVRSFLKSLRLLDPSELKIQPLAALMKNRVSDNKNEQFWPLFVEALLDIEPEHLSPGDFEHFLDALVLSSDYVGTGELTERLEQIIEAHQNQGRLSGDQRLELLSRLLPFDKLGGETQAEQIRDHLLPQLRSGLQNDVVARYLADYIGRSGDNEHFEAMALYIDGASPHRQAGLAIALSRPLGRRLNTCIRYNMPGEFLSVFRMALRTLPLLPPLERADQLHRLIHHFSKAVDHLGDQLGPRFPEAYRSILDLSRREKSDLARQLQIMADGLPNHAFDYERLRTIRRLAA